MNCKCGTRRLSANKGKPKETIFYRHCKNEINTVVEFNPNRTKINTVNAM